MKGKKAIKISGFKLEQRKDKKTNEVKKDHVPILCEFRINKERAKYPIGYRIDAEKWNYGEQIVKKNNFNQDGVSYAVINRRIQDIKEKLPQVYYELECNATNVSPKSVWQELTDRIHEADGLNSKKQIKGKTIQDYLQEFIEDESINKDWSDNTKKKIITLKNHLAAYNLNTVFGSIDHKYLQGFIEFLRTKNNHNNTTIKKYMKSLYWFLNWATDKNYNTNTEFKTYSFKLKGTKNSDYQSNIIFLLWDELMMLYSLDLTENPRLAQVRDVYCFCCFTGLRYSDVANLKKSDFKADNTGNTFIEFTTIKTDDSLTIGLNKYALALAEKYKDIPLIGNKAFPVLSNQKYNDYLKELGQLAGLNSIEKRIEYKGNRRIEITFHKWELLTSHTARKTFVTNALAMGIQPDVIRKWTGHKDHKTMETYIKIVEAQKQTAMNKFNER